MIDQNNPGHWMALGVVIMIVGVIVANTVAAGFGWLVLAVGALLLVVGVVMTAMRAGSKPPDS